MFDNSMMLGLFVDINDNCNVFDLNKWYTYIFQTLGFILCPLGKVGEILWFHAGAASAVAFLC